MGACVSRPEGCVGAGLRAPRRVLRRRRRGGAARRRKAMETIPEAPLEAEAVDGTVAYSNPTFQVLSGSLEDIWFDTYGTQGESDCEDEFLSVPDDASSLNGGEVAPSSNVSSFRDANSEDDNTNSSVASGNQSLNSHRQGKHIVDNAISSVNIQSVKTSANTKHEALGVRVDEVSGHGDGGLLENCGILPSNCLPCLAPSGPAVEKRRSSSLSPPSSRKKASSKLSFKWRSGEGHPYTPRDSLKFLERPLAGTQVQFSLLEKKIFDSWSYIEPSSFKVRGEHYSRDKKKEFAPKHAAYYPFGVDVFLCEQKIDHIARHVELPEVNTSGKFPSLLIVNVQVPLYPATIFQSEADGEGMSIVLYFKLSENFGKEMPYQFQESFRKFIDDEVERVKGFPVDTISSFRERLKILGRVGNINDLHLSGAERKLMHAYNEKPVLSRPQHEFYLGGDYFEVDIDMHRFSYISRKGFEVFLDRLKICILDVGLTIQGNKADELPEHVLCCVRLSGIDYANYRQLAVT